MEKVIIKPGCIACGTCAFLAPEVFEVTDQSRVKKNAALDIHKEAISQAIKACPVSVIHRANKDEPLPGNNKP